MIARRSILIAGLALSAGLLGMLPLAGPASAGGGGCHERTATEGTGSVVTIKENGCFGPTVLHVDKGTTVTFENAQSGSQHNVHGLDWGTWVKAEDQELTFGETYAFAFRKPGYYPYSCTLHYNMVGLVIVGEPGGSETLSAKLDPAATVEPESVASEASTDEDSGGISTWAILTGAGVLALGIVGGGAILRARKR